MIPSAAGDVDCPHGVALDDHEVAAQRAVLERLSIPVAEFVWTTDWCRRCRGERE